MASADSSAPAPGGRGRQDIKPGTDVTPLGVPSHDAAGPMAVGAPEGSARGAPGKPAGTGFWGRHPVDIRFSLPFPGGCFYITVLSGPERRTPGRRAEQRHHYPLRTAANIFFVFGAAAAFYALALVVLAFASSLIEW